MSRRLHRSAAAGFTLIELLIAGLISGMVMIAIYVVFIANTDQYYRQEQIVQMQEGMRFAIEYLKNDLRNVGRQSVANGVVPGGPNSDPGYCGPADLRGAQLFDNEDGPSVLDAHGNGLKPDRLRLMVDASGGTALAVSGVSGSTVKIFPAAGQLSEDGRSQVLPVNQAAFEAMYKAGYYVRIASDANFLVLPISEVDFGNGTPSITTNGNVSCVSDPSFCLAGGCLVNPVRLVEYLLVEDRTVDAIGGEFKKSDLVRQVIHSIEDTPIAAERVTVAEFIVNLQLWGTYDTRATAIAVPLIPADPDPTDDVGNWGGAAEADRFNNRPERIRTLNVLLARRSSREDEEFRVAPGAADAPEARVAADLTWFDLDGNGEPERKTGLARVATLRAGVETPNLVTGQ